MPPKKRETEASKGPGAVGGGVVRIDHLQADHELFLQAFEKPTQIYRFLRTRNVLKPIYLNRTLSYMRQRMSRSHKSRIGFKVDSILERVIQKSRNELQSHTMGDYMTLTFLGFHNKTINTGEESQVKVEAILLKLCHKKRKDSSAAGVEISVGTCSVPVNPSFSSPPAMAPAFSISSETFTPSHGPDVKSYVLMFRVCVSQRLLKNNNQMKFNDDSDSEPSHKKCKTMDICQRVLRSELVVYDKHNRCLLKNGEYEMLLRESTPQVRSPHKGLPTHWETLSKDTVEVISGDNNPFDVFALNPTLKVKLSWSHEPTKGIIARPKPLPNPELAPIQNVDNSKTDSNFNNNNQCNKENNKPSSNPARLINSTGKGVDSALDKSQNGIDKSVNCLQIIYQFLYNNNSRQQTEACEDLHCPWCSLDCGRLYSLLKHLKLCHSRFNFTYYPIPNGARIDVSINESYDGSYAGSPHWACMSGGTRGGSGPGRRAPLTQTLVCHPPRRHPNFQNNLAEFREIEDNDITIDGQRPYITGHNRLYHHTISCLPVNPKELEVDSEGETDPLWLQQKTMMMIDEFTDVNEGEKELMKMWNLHVMKYNFVGDCQIPLACQMFVQTRGKELLEKNLYRNFVLHMCSLHDFGLISPVIVYQTIQMLNQLLTENDEVKVKIRKNILLQREHWKAHGMHQQPNLEPKSAPQPKPSFTTFNGDSSPAVRRKTSNINYTPNPSSSSTSGSEAKKKAEMTHTSCAATHALTNSSTEKDVKKNIPSSGNSIPSKNVNPCTLMSPQVLLRRKSVGSSQVLNSNSNKKRLSLNERKNST